MDLQAILDASSSSSCSSFPPKHHKSYSDGLSDISSALHESTLHHNGAHRNSYDSDEQWGSSGILNSKRSGNNLELERILRDDDDEDDDEDVVKKSTRRETDLLHSILNEDNDSLEDSLTSINDDDDDEDGNNNNNFMNSVSGVVSSVIPMSHSREVDAILDMHDDDMSDEDEENNSDSYSKFRRRRMLSSATFEDEEEEMKIGVRSSNSNSNLLYGAWKENGNVTYETITTQYPLARGTYLDKPYPQNLEGESSLKESTASFLYSRQPRHSPKIIPPPDVSTTAPEEEEEEENTNDKISRLCLRTAEHHEHRLLKPNHRTVISPLSVKRRMKPKVALHSKSRQHVVSGLSSHHHHPRVMPPFGFSGIVQMKSTSLKDRILQSNARRSTIRPSSGDSNKHQDGLPTTIAFNSKFIAVGTQHGEVWIFDWFEQLKLTLEDTTNSSNTTKNNGAVTSMDLPIHHDHILVGYASGSIILWDIIKGTILKGMYELHSSPITAVRLVTPSTSSNEDIHAVTVDASGLVHKIMFAKGIMRWSAYSAETECLLDGTAGQILAMDALPPPEDEGAESRYHSSALKIVLIALSSDRSSFAVSVLPKVSVLHKWARPVDDRIDPSGTFPVDDGVSDITMSYAPTCVGSSALGGAGPKEPERMPFLPCLSWGWGLVSGGKNSVTPILARSWGCCIQFLCANFPPSEEGDTVEDDGEIHWPAFGLHDEFDASAPVVSLSWLGTRSLVYLTISNEFTIIDTVIMTMQERLDFSGIKLVYAEFALSRPKSKESNLCTTFMNSIRSNDNRLLILCQEEVKQLTVLGITQQISSLEEGGQWLEALALSLDHYESTIQSQEDGLRSAKGVMSHNDKSLLSEDEIWMADLLMRYLLLAIDNAPEPESFSMNKRLNLAQSHFEMLSGVCLEYCVTMKRLDLLYGPIFRCFYEARYINVFLDVMETYILNDRLNYIAPEAMVLFVAHCRDMKEISMVERCLLHLDCRLMDFDSILTLLKNNALYTGLLYVYSTGLDDYTSPLEVLFEGIFDALNNSRSIHNDCRKEGVLSTAFEEYGYKALMYIRYCLSGKTFPKGGEQTIPEGRMQKLRAEILEFLFRETISTTSYQKGINQRRHGIRSTSYPHIRALVLVDAKAFLDCLSIVLDDPEATFDEAANIDVIGSWDVEYGTDSDRIQSGLGLSTSSEKDPKLLPDRQYLVNILSSIFMTDDVVTFDNNFGIREPSQITTNAKNAFLDFLAKHLELGVFTAPRYLTAEVMTRLCSKSKKSTSEDQILSLLKALPRSSYELDEVLYTVERTHMSRCALFLYQSGVSRTIDRPSMSEKCKKYFNRAIDCFLRDKDIEFRKGLFEYANKECSGGGASLPNADSSSSPLREVLLRRISELVELDPIETSKLVSDQFAEDIDKILSSLKGIDSGRVQYSFFHAIISDLPKIDSAAAQEIESNLTKEHHHNYLSLMTRFQPDRVYSYLSTNQHYRLEDALKLCQDRRVTDGSAYLLERMGDVSGAILLMLQTFDMRMIGLKNIIQESMSSLPPSRSRVKTISVVKASINNNEAAEKELAAAKQTLGAVLDLCERNKNDYLMLENERGPLLWFHVLDRLVNAKHLLGAYKTATQHHLSAISTILSELLLMTMQRMTHHVSHFDLMQKITGDHAGSDLGEFREMLVSMLKTYSSELDVCSNAVNVMHHDIRSLSVQRKNLKVRGSFIPECPKPHSNNAVLEIHPSGSFQVTTRSHGKYHDNEIMQSNSFVSLRQRRRLNSQRSMIGGMSRQNKRGKCSRALNFMTASERQFSLGKTPLDTAYSFDESGGARQIGVLSKAQNVGGLL